MASTKDSGPNGMSPEPKKPAKSPSRLSLYGMKPEDALKKALSTAPPAKSAKKQPKKAGN